jgi:hypothetical protein
MNGPIYPISIRFLSRLRRAIRSDRHQAGGHRLLNGTCTGTDSIVIPEGLVVACSDGGIYMGFRASMRPSL